MKCSTTKSRFLNMLNISYLFPQWSCHSYQADKTRSVRPPSSAGIGHRSRPPGYNCYGCDSRSSCHIPALSTRCHRCTRTPDPRNTLRARSHRNSWKETVGDQILKSLVQALLSKIGCCQDISIHYHVQSKFTMRLKS